VGTAAGFDASTILYPTRAKETQVEKQELKLLKGESD
jgi:hypothetical protein